MRITCVRQLHRGELEADPAGLFEPLGLQDTAGPLLGRHHLVPLLPVQTHGGLAVSLQPALQADGLALSVVLDRTSGNCHPQICSEQ